MSELKAHIQSGLLVSTFIIIAASASKPIALFLLSFISFLALKEYLSLIHTRRADRRVLFWAYLAVPFQYYWIWLEWYGMFVIFIPVYVLLFLAAQMVVIGETKGFLNAIGIIHWGLMMTVFSLGHLAYILVLPPDQNPMGGNRGLVLFLVAITQINDIAHYSIDILGKKFFRNRPRIMPALAPLKTLEGFLIATVVTVFSTWFLAPYLTFLKPYEAISLGIILAVGGFIGDMVISTVKKDLGREFFSNKGVMNRIDSLTYTAPLFFHFIYYFKY
jgi:phosphatidate cytidylyltransferase